MFCCLHILGFNTMIEEASEYFGEGWLVFSVLAFELF